MKIFLSYCHENRAEADYIDTAFIKAGYEIIRDIRDVTYKSDLPDYCKSISQYNAAICLISDAYLKSRWCMFEIIQLMKEKQFVEKIYPVVMTNAKIFSADERLDYIQYWQEKYEKLKNKADGLDLSALSEIALELKLYTYIKNEMGTFTTTLGNWLLWKYGELKDADFKKLINVMPDSHLKQF